MPIKDAPVKFSRYPLLPIAVSFATGIVAEQFAGFNTAILLVGCAVFVLLSLVFRGLNFSAFPVSIAFLFLGAYCLSAEVSGVSADRLKAMLDSGIITSGDPIEIEGVLLGKPEPTANGFQLTLRAEKIIRNNTEITASGNVKFFATMDDNETADEYGQLDLGYGSRIRVACNPIREDAFLNSGVMPRGEILDRQGIDATAIIKSPLLIEKIGEDRVFLPLAWIYEQRQNLIFDFSEKFNTPTAGVLIASLLGDKYFLDKQTADIFREGGTFHVLVISGLHITFIGGLTLLFLRFFTKKKLWQFLFVSTFLWAYTFAVGADVPVVRASIMFTVLLFSQVIYRRGTLLNSLALCALLLLSWRPSDLFNPSFQLTFVSVGAIVAMAFPLIEKLRKIGSWTPTTAEPFPPNVPQALRRFCEMLYWRENAWKIEANRQIWSARLFKSPYLKWLEAKALRGLAAYIFEGILVSIIVQVWVLPLLVVYFHRVSPVSVLLNLWVGLVIALESFAAVIAVGLGHVNDILAMPFVGITELLNSLLLAIPKLFVESDWASWRIPVYSGPAKAIYFLYFVPVLLLAAAAVRWNAFALKHQKKLGKILYVSGIAAAILAAVMVFHPFSSPTPDGRLRIDFLDVGQGDSALVTFPTGETMLIDGGGRMSFSKSDSDSEIAEAFEQDLPRIGEAVVSEFLWEKGYSKIDFIVATHADADHIQGLTDVARNFEVKQALFGRMPIDDTNFAELAKILRKKNIRQTTAASGESFSIGGVQIDVLYPDTDKSPPTPSDNDYSVVLRITFGIRTFLLTGDIEQAAENDLLGDPDFLKADVIKVPHHGSRTSSTPPFVDAVKADYAIISVGNRSRFGHPNADVVERWKLSGAETMTTGSRGTVMVSTDGSDLQISQFKQ